MNATIAKLYGEYLAVTDNPQAAATLVLAHITGREHTEYMSVKQAAKQMGVSIATVYQLCTDGQLRHRKIGRCVRIQPEDLRDYMDANNKQPKPNKFSCLSL